jgi:hypothetical protein
VHRGGIGDRSRDRGGEVEAMTKSRTLQRSRHFWRGFVLGVLFSTGIAAVFGATAGLLALVAR